MFTFAKDMSRTPHALFSAHGVVSNLLFTVKQQAAVTDRERVYNSSNKVE